jgi:hypothetical protein
MADNPELAAKLQELDHELEEGDITQKGCVAAVAVLPLFRRHLLPSHCCNTMR